MSTFNNREDITWRDILVRAAVIICTVAITVWAMPNDSRNYFRVEQGKPWKYGDLTAPFDFPIYKSEEAIRQQRDSILGAYEPYYRLNSDAEGSRCASLCPTSATGFPGSATTT